MPDSTEQDDSEQILRLLSELQSGREEAADELFALLYDELRIVAGRVFRSQADNHTLQPTALLHEAYLKIIRPGAESGWQDRSHLLNLAARAMRQVLVNHARDKGALKRGGPDCHRVTLGPELPGSVGTSGPDVLDLDEALTELSTLDARQAQVVELKIFGGQKNPEIAESLGVSLRTVELDWKMAKAWLGTRLRTGDEE